MPVSCALVREPRTPKTTIFEHIGLTTVADTGVDADAETVGPIAVRDKANPKLAIARSGLSHIVITSFLISKGGQ